VLETGVIGNGLPSSSRAEIPLRKTASSLVREKTPLTVANGTGCIPGHAIVLARRPFAQYRAPVRHNKIALNAEAFLKEALCWPLLKIAAESSGISMYLPRAEVLLSVIRDTGDARLYSLLSRRAEERRHLNKAARNRQPRYSLHLALGRYEIGSRLDERHCPG
jgi:hypothetical protein